MNPRLIIAFVAGAIVGASAVYFLPRNPPPDTAQNEVKVAALEREIAAKTEQIKQLTAAAPNAINSPKTAGPDKGPDNAEMTKFRDLQKKREEKIKTAMANKLKLKVDERLAVMKQKLGLTDQQAAAIRPAIEKFIQSTDISQLMLSMQSEEGQSLTPEDHKAKERQFFEVAIDPVKNQTAMEAQITALLTPDQMTAYSGLKQEQRANAVEIAANKELGRLQSAMTLTPEQKDQAFAVLSRLANDDHDKPIPSIIALASLNPGGQQDMAKQIGEDGAAKVKELAAESKNRKQRRLEAMKGILTPEQYCVYEAQQKDTSAELSEAMSEFGGMMMHGAVGEDEEAGDDFSIPNQK